MLNLKEMYEKGEFRYRGNCAGDLFEEGDGILPGKDITEKELPSELQIAVRDLWNENSGLCLYPVRWFNTYGILAVCEYDESYAKNCGITTGNLYKVMEIWADAEVEEHFKLLNMCSLSSNRFSGIQVAVGNPDIDKEYSIAVFIPWNTDKRTFIEIISWLNKCGWPEPAKAHKILDALKHKDEHKPHVIYRYYGAPEPMEPVELADAANELLTPEAVLAGRRMTAQNYKIGAPESRLKGKLCNCEDGGEFILYPVDALVVQEGGKRYMKCLKCGCVSHL